MSCGRVNKETQPRCRKTWFTALRKMTHFDRCDETRGLVNDLRTEPTTETTPMTRTYTVKPSTLKPFMKGEWSRRAAAPSCVPQSLAVPLNCVHIWTKQKVITTTQARQTHCSFSYLNTCKQTNPVWWRLRRSDSLSDKQQRSPDITNRTSISAGRSLS